MTLVARLTSPLLFSALLASQVASPAFAADANDGQERRKHSRLFDADLRRAADEESPQPQRVIIRVRPGSRSEVQRALSEHGDRILAEHESLDAISALVHGEDLAELSEHSSILSV